MTVSWPADTKLFVRGTTATRKGHSAQNDAAPLAQDCSCRCSDIATVEAGIGRAPPLAARSLLRWRPTAAADFRATALVDAMH
jgi:hypothetical protein